MKSAASPSANHCLHKDPSQTFSLICTFRTLTTYEVRELDFKVRPAVPVLSWTPPRIFMIGLKPNVPGRPVIRMSGQGDPVSGLPHHHTPPSGNDKPARLREQTADYVRVGLIEPTHTGERF